VKRQAATPFTHHPLLTPQLSTLNPQLIKAHAL
jgi:hypothetical protein